MLAPVLNQGFAASLLYLFGFLRLLSRDGKDPTLNLPRDFW